MEVESTTRSAKERVAGFEGREGHRTPFAPVANNIIILKSLVEVTIRMSFAVWLWCQLWCQFIFDLCYGLSQFPGDASDLSDARFTET